ncbi:hypothetical protein B0A55_11126 [Friedmanniomyces simplex]|uniref:tRNA (adenine(58)-N(1))-methyltransferase catalytic subunit TRM61 n=1 Tax=Friedmanniomyces simplex TaxID=329884 RepID=A0A4U0WGJ4_9PEZI|nr:hypothetical protein B0A55_11126 [Friedmanniomyces simplex]
MRRAVLLARPLQSPPHHNTRHLTSFHRADRVLLRPTKRNRNTTYASPILTQPLNPSHHLDTPRGRIRHDEIIGRGVRDIVHTGTTGGKKSRDGGGNGNGNGNASASGLEYRLHEVRLEEYVRFTRRLVTPLYPQDAQVIVGLMDLHPEPAQWGEDQGERLEILEAGTGHGALTLYLSRGVHAANPPIPRHLRHVQEEGDGEEEADHTAIEAWRSTRRAIIHSVEISPKYSAHAEKMVRGFRHGMYTHNVDFHVNSVTPFVQSHMDSHSDQPFLSHAFLDLPGTEQHLAAVSSALKTDGPLIVFCPSITQIMACLSTVKEDVLPLELEKVLELGVNGGTGGREWDVRAVRPRANQKADAGVETRASVAEEDSASGGGAESETREDSGVDVRQGKEKVEQGSKAGEHDDGGGGAGGWKMVCRPKVGELVVGGGFLGVFRKQRRDIAE